MKGLFLSFPYRSRFLLIHVSSPLGIRLQGLIDAYRVVGGLRQRCRMHLRPDMAVNTASAEILFADGLQTGRMRKVCLPV